MQIAIANSCKASIEFSEQLKVGWNKRLIMRTLTHTHTTHTHTHTQKRFSLELGDSAIDTKFGSKFKQIADEFDAIGHKWYNI